MIDWSRTRQEAVFSNAENRFLTGAAPKTHSLAAASGFKFRRRLSLADCSTSPFNSYQNLYRDIEPDLETATSSRAWLHPILKVQT